MNIANPVLNVVIEAEKVGDTRACWQGKPVSVRSRWALGSEQEKFEVLAALRRLYNPDQHGDIRGATAQTPAQIGQSEGFIHLQYRYADSPQAPVCIVKGLSGYSRLPARATA